MCQSSVVLNMKYHLDVSRIFQVKVPQAICHDALKGGKGILKTECH